MNTSRNAISIDVEDYFHVSALAPSIDRSDWDKMEYRAEASTDRLLALFDEFDTRATFFVLGWVARRSPQLIRAIHSAGHEVACHGLSHQLVYSQTPEQFRSETEISKSMLEDTIGQSVDGYRAASWSITSRSLWALDILLDAGFRYDSSIFPIRHDLYGIPGAPQHPDIVRTPSGLDLLEFPPSTVSTFGLRVPISGGGYFRIFPYWLTRALMKRALDSTSAPLLFYLHPWEIDPEQPRIRTSRKSAFRHYTNLGKTESRLRRLLADFSWTTVRNVLIENGFSLQAMEG